MLLSFEMEKYVIVKNVKNKVKSRGIQQQNNNHGKKCELQYLCQQILEEDSNKKKQMRATECSLKYSTTQKYFTIKLMQKL